MLVSTITNFVTEKNIYLDYFCKSSIETGAFEVAKDSLTVSDQLLARLTDAQIWFVRIGHRAVHRVGLIGANLFQ
ncbi:MAG: hypothetical protein EWV92_07840 [Microcystis aeruginosa Ma_MB_S_20031200_S102]|uniref:Uncharacterized protein n=1 Tax=Microcystis aeruginosa Ma_MB_S_20031200_S102 TaxID=2486254 RepID=A0A552EW97_MICAE|nr:MAG: hypothetical protein EWV79_02835 [Microcystis aeruginosa Ma_MB_S_20031200_S102D]TRU38754.1 MAG: hypothetical protein EWV92_07840 [Microcystis aeruginosa Ma_MB_S_20031200_S102]